MRVSYEIKEFPIEPHVAIKRSLARDYTVPASVINKQYKQWRKYKGLPEYTGTRGKPKAVIFDIDGTLAEMRGRHPFEWDKVKEDSAKTNVVDLAYLMSDNMDYELIVLSGRDGVCHHDTFHWLLDKHIPFDRLFMRDAGDNRPDAQIKEEIFWRDVAPNYDVKLVVDDRDQMVARWRAMGLECWQVAEGDF